MAGFRKDLLCRINSCHIELTLLRTRLSKTNLGKEVLDGIVERYCEGMGLSLTDGARREFDSFACRYAWPGNFRDVRHLFENLNVMSISEGAGRVVSAYAMKKALTHLESAKTSNGGVDGDDMRHDHSAASTEQFFVFHDFSHFCFSLYVNCAMRCSIPLAISA